MALRCPACGSQMVTRGVVYGCSYGPYRGQEYRCEDCLSTFRSGECVGVAGEQQCQGCVYRTEQK